ncbi:hypothetical protein WJX79_009050 [Trebouxia sp. C0005]
MTSWTQLPVAASPAGQLSLSLDLVLQISASRKQSVLSAQVRDNVSNALLASVKLPECVKLDTCKLDVKDGYCAISHSLLLLPRRYQRNSSKAIKLPTDCTSVGFSVNGGLRLQKSYNRVNSQSGIALLKNKKGPEVAFEAFSVLDGFGRPSAPLHASKTLVASILAALDGSKPIARARKDASDEQLGFALQVAFTEALPKALLEGYSASDADLRDHVKEEGTMATVAFVCGRQLVVATAGTSCAYLDTGAHVYSMSKRRRADAPTPGLAPPPVMQATIPEGGARLIMASGPFWDIVTPSQDINNVRKHAAKDAPVKLQAGAAKQGLKVEPTVFVVDLAPATSAAGLIDLQKLCKQKQAQVKKLSAVQQAAQQVAEPDTQSVSASQSGPEVGPAMITSPPALSKSAKRKIAQQKTARNRATFGWAVLEQQQLLERAPRQRARRERKQQAELQHEENVKAAEGQHEKMKHAKASGCNPEPEAQGEAVTIRMVNGGKGHNLDSTPAQPQSPQANSSATVHQIQEPQSGNRTSRKGKGVGHGVSHEGSQGRADIRDLQPSSAAGFIVGVSDSPEQQPLSSGRGRGGGRGSSGEQSQGRDRGRGGHSAHLIQQHSTQGHITPPPGLAPMRCTIVREHALSPTRRVNAARAAAARATRPLQVIPLPANHQRGQSDSHSGAQAQGSQAPGHPFNGHGRARGHKGQRAGHGAGPAATHGAVSTSKGSSQPNQALGGVIRAPPGLQQGVNNHWWGSDRGPPGLPPGLRHGATGQQQDSVGASPKLPPGLSEGTDSPAASGPEVGPAMMTSPAALSKSAKRRIAQQNTARNRATFGWAVLEQQQLLERAPKEKARRERKQQAELQHEENVKAAEGQHEKMKRAKASGCNPEPEAQGEAVVTKGVNGGEEHNPDSTPMQPQANSSATIHQIQEPQSGSSAGRKGKDGGHGVIHDGSQGRRDTRDPQPSSAAGVIVAVSDPPQQQPASSRRGRGGGRGSRGEQSRGRGRGRAGHSAHPIQQHLTQGHITPPPSLAPVRGTILRGVTRAEGLVMAMALLQPMVL